MKFKHLSDIQQKIVAFVAGCVLVILVTLTATLPAILFYTVKYLMKATT